MTKIFAFDMYKQNYCLNYYRQPIVHDDISNTAETIKHLKILHNYHYYQ